MPTHDIIDNRNQKLVDNINCILDSSDAAHFAVGYFFLSGFIAIAPRLATINQMRLLIGNTSNRETIEQLAEGYRRLELIKDQMVAQTAENIRSSVELMDQTDAAETLVRNLVQMIEEKRLQVRVYTKGRLHAKAYIFDYGKVYNQLGQLVDRAENGIAVVGSSNLTLSGISHNTELNVIVHGNDNHQHLTHWYNQLWEDAEDFDETLMQQMQQSWVMAPTRPYDIYMKTLYMLVRDRIQEENRIEIIADDAITQQLADFQNVAVNQAIKIIRDYGGCFVSDVVGLGKSFIGAAIVKRFEQVERARPLILCPAPLVEMWERYNEVYHLNARVLSLGMLREDGENGENRLVNDFRYQDRDFILIDESHNLRNPSTQRYKIVETFLATGKQCCFLTATPRNKSAWDIYNQIKLFHPDDKTDLPVDPPDLKAYFKLVEVGDRDLPNLLSHILIRRTRNHILRWYGFDAQTHQPVEPTNFSAYLNGKRRAYVIVGGKHQFFPQRQLETIEYSIEDTYQGLYQQLRHYLGKSRKRQLTNPPANELCYARYGIGNYVLKAKQKKDPYSSLQTAGANLRGLIRVLLFKRFESSVEAFRETVKKLLNAHYLFEKALTQGFVPAGEEAQSILYEPNQGEEQDILDALRQASGKYKLADFDAKRLHQHIHHDIQLFKKILALVQPITPAQDTKLQTLKSGLNQAPLTNGKRLIFTQYADTARYLYENLNPDGKQDDIDVIYSGDKSKARIVGRFAPKANPDYQFSRNETEINTLIATDVLAEGLNLQDGNLIINYDLHWNPVRLIQRFGRIDRIGSENDIVYGFNFLPETGLDRNLGLRRILANRIAEIHETIGEDAAILDPTEQLNEDAMYAIYEKNGDSQQLSLFEDNGEYLDLNEAEEILRQLQKDNPTEYKRIANLPHGIRTAKFSLNKGLFVFCEASYPNRPELKGYQQLVLLDDQGEIVSRDISRILGRLKSSAQEEGLSLPQDYNAAVMRIKRQFAEDVKHRQAERDYSRNLSQGQKYSLRELRLFFETINDEDIKAQINLLEKAFREPVTTGLKRELNRLKRNSITGNELFIKLKQLYAQYDRHEWLNRRQKDEDYLVPIIVCSEALV